MFMQDDFFKVCQENSDINLLQKLSTYKIFLETNSDFLALYITPHLKPSIYSRYLNVN